MAEIPKGLRGSHAAQCAQQVILQQGKQPQETEDLEQPRVFSGWEVLEYSEVPREGFPDRLEHKSSGFFFPCHCHPSQALDYGGL